jgi:DNA-binding LacI/PurR family transcriptional regulator
LENRGLIYRKHGKGTFANGNSTRIHRYLGILMKSPHASEHRPIAEMVRGAQTVMAALRSAVLLASTPPEQWRAEKASSLGGVIVVPQDVTEKDLEVLKDRSIPYLLFTESSLPGPTIRLGQKEAARTVTQQLLQQGHRRFALLSGYDICLDATKRQGIHEAFRESGIDPAQVPEISAHGHEDEIFQAARAILDLRPRPTAVIAFDDSQAAVMNFHARRQAGMTVPNDLSIVGFHDWPYLSFTDMKLTTVRFEFFNAGKSGAEALSQAALTGQPLSDISFPPCYRPGQSDGPAPSVS